MWYNMCGVWRVFIVGGVGVYLRVLVCMGVHVLCIVGGVHSMCGIILMCGVWRVFIVAWVVRVCI